jgi:integrase
MKFLSAEQSQHLLKFAAADRFHALYVLAISTGMRMGELFALAWPDIDFDSASIMVQRSLEEISGELTIKEPKTPTSRRRIDLPAFAVDALQGHRRRMLAEGHVAGPVFCDTKGGYLRRSNFRRNSFEPLLARGDLPEVRFHDLRHTAATLLLLRGIHPKIVSERLGHARVQITLDRYSHVLPTMQKEAADQLERLLG